MASDGGGYCEEFMYTVTDELVSIATVVSLCREVDERVEEAELSIGVEEALALLNASLTFLSRISDAMAET